MGKPKPKPHHDNQHQHQHQSEWQSQAQGQSQYQGTWQVAGLKSESDNKNDNKNANINYDSNKNDNDNKNDNKNANVNYSSNKADNDVKNDVDNKLDNSVDNKVDNDVKNTVENHVENKVDVAVDVKVDLDLSAADLGVHDNDVIDIENISDIYGSVIMPDAVSQTLNGNGNIFNIDQVNNLVDNDYNYSNLSFSAGANPDWCCDTNDPTGATFSMWGDAKGGSAKVDDVDAKVGDDGDITGAATATADGIVTQEAFTQNIVLGANIQFNSIDMNVAGNDLTMEDVV